MLESIRDRGFALLCDVPTELSMTEEIPAVIGKRRETNYGIYELKAKADPEITGDMAVELTPHTDEMYRIEPPAITLFHVVVQSPIGGESVLVDGLRLAQRLKEKILMRCEHFVKFPHVSIVNWTRGGTSTYRHLYFARMQTVLLPVLG